MSDSVQQFEDAYWRHGNQREAFRHRQALEWITKEDGPILDIGCGDGFFLEKLRERGIDGWGVDISSVAIDKCHEKGLSAEVADFGRGVLPDRSAKTAVSLDVLEHLYDPAPLLKSLHARGIRTLIISVPNFVSMPARLQVLFGKVPENNTPRKGHVYWYTVSVLRQRLEENGWIIETWASHPFHGHRRLLGFVWRWLGSVWPSLFSLSLVIKARIRV